MGPPRKDLEWVPVNSSNLEMVAFEPYWEEAWRQVGGHHEQYHKQGDTGTLHIIFNPPDSAGPRHYAYADVPCSVYEALLAAPSKGKYHHAAIKWKYAYTEF